MTRISILIALIMSACGVPSERNTGITVPNDGQRGSGEQVYKPGKYRLVLYAAPELSRSFILDALVGMSIRVHAGKDSTFAGEYILGRGVQGNNIQGYNIYVSNFVLHEEEVVSLSYEFNVPDSLNRRILLMFGSLPNP